MEDEAKSIVAPGGPIVPEEYVRSPFPILKTL